MPNRTGQTPARSRAVRPLPQSSDLAQDRQYAGELLEDIRAGNSSAIERLRARHPRFDGRDEAYIRAHVALPDALLVIAREYGFGSWPRWKELVELRLLDRQARAEALIRAVWPDDVRRARLLLATDPTLAQADFFTACVCGEVHTVRELLASDPGLACRKGGPLDREPILYACSSRLFRAHLYRRQGILQIVRLLLDHGADPNVGFIEEWISRDWLQSTLYMAAGVANDPQLLQILLNGGARLRPDDKETMYHVVEFVDTTCLRLLLQHARPSTDQLNRAVYRALSFDRPEHVCMLLAAGADANSVHDSDGRRTLLHTAVHLGRSAHIVRQRIDAGGDPNVVDEHGVSVLATAERNRHEALIEALRSSGARDVSTVPGAAAGPPDPVTLCLAARHNDVPLIDRLVQLGANVNAQAGSFGMRPLNWAAWAGCFAAVRRLVEHGADVHWLNSFGGNIISTALHGSLFCFAVEGGPSVGLPEEARAGDYPDIIEYLHALGVSLPDEPWGSEEAQDVLRKRGVHDKE